MSSLNDEYEAAVKIDTLVPLENNPRRGDLDMLHDSVDTIGFYGACIVNRSTREVLVGNHRMQAARDKGMDTVPVIWVDVDDVRAKKIALVDNHANDRATYDVHDLLLSLEALDNDFDGTGYSDDDYADLLAVATADPPEPGDGDGDPIGDVQDYLSTGKLTISDVPIEVLEAFRAVEGDDDLARLKRLLHGANLLDAAD